MQITKIPRKKSKGGNGNNWQVFAKINIVIFSQNSGFSIKVLIYRINTLYHLHLLNLIEKLIEIMLILTTPTVFILRKMEKKLNICIISKKMYKT